MKARAMRILFAALGSIATISAGYAAQSVPTLPQATRLYLVTDKAVSSKRGESDVGTVVPCRVWRDVELEGHVFIKAGTAASCEVDKVKRRNMGGSEGKVSIAGRETKSADGQVVMLSGGYNKDGSGRKAVVWTVGLLLLWPVLFVPGGQAELPPGTVFDVSTVNDLHLKIEETQLAAAPRIDLSSMQGGLSASAMIDDLLAQKKPETLRLKLSKESPFPKSVAIDTVNGKSVPPIAVTLGPISEVETTTTSVAEVRLKDLAKHFQKGINRFEVAYQEDGARKATEVILDVQM